MARLLVDLYDNWCITLAVRLDNPVAGGGGEIEYFGYGIASPLD